MIRISLILTLLMASGCVQKLPLVSHAHMGHTLTAWHDTPDQQGLFAVAEQEIELALSEAQLAMDATGDDRRVRRHASNVVNALNPDIQPIGPGLGYGGLRAFEGGIDHLEFAATSADASDNMIRSVADIALAAESIVAQLNAALRHAQAAEALSGSALDDEITRMALALDVAVYGRVPRAPAAARDVSAAAVRDAAYDNGRGSGHESHSNTGHSSDSASKQNPSALLQDQRMGLVHMDVVLSAMLKRESNPPYQPVPRRYVLGLIRMPTGEWLFRLPRSERNRHSGHTGYGGY